MKVCCPCDVIEHPGKPEIAAGLPALLRQLAGFPQYRLAMLRDIPLHLALSGWRAREGDDLGVMLLEMWAYVLDVLGFYDERIANEAYLRTAALGPSLHKLVTLIGYRPRPALAASVILAAIADGKRLVTLPPRTGFRSDAFDGQPPQVFETEFKQAIHPLKNQWTLAPVREKALGGELLLEIATAALKSNQLVLLRLAGTGALLRAGRVKSIETIEALDGQTYRRLVIDPAADLPASVLLEAVDVLTPTRTAAVTATATTDILQTAAADFFAATVAFRSISTGERVTGIGRLPASRNVITLDAVYSELAEQDAVMILRGNALHAATITAIENVDVTVHPGATGIPPSTLPATRITINPALPRTWAADPRRLVVHFNLTPAGKLTSIARIRLGKSDFANPGLAVEGVVEPLPEGVTKPGELLLSDAQGNGAFANGSVEINARGEGRVSLVPGANEFAPRLRTPVTVFANLVRATRGESVLDEGLGSGDAAQVFQSFTLGKAPLTYINDPAAPDGRRTTLEVRVNGIKWEERASFFGARPQDEVYIVRQNDGGQSIITFGDGITGARLPTGVDNITATYRFGAGAAKPPAGAISQLAKPVEGLRRVVNPVAAGGGADADQPKAIRTNAPSSALILGRAISVPDFQALAREFGGVINAHVEWAWDESSQGAVVMVWFISSGGDIARSLRAFLIGQADPNTPLVALEAEAQPSRLVIDLDIDPRFTREAVVAQVKQAMTNPDTGLLALENIEIGRPLFRSRIFDAVLAVEGTRSVHSMTVDGEPAPFAITVGQGRYRHFLDGLVIKSRAAGNSLAAR
jgi:predicted phage baseplate assembly protein